MIYILTHRVEVETPQKATALRDKAAAAIAGDAVTVIVSAMALDQQVFSVVGVDTAANEPFTELVQADSADAAKADVESDSKVVAFVTQGPIRDQTTTDEPEDTP